MVEVKERPDGALYVIHYAGFFDLGGRKVFVSGTGPGSGFIELPPGMARGIYRVVMMP